jgi:lipopolysaccharide heptosyltransferase II
MNIDFQRRVDRHAGTLLCRLLSCLPGARRNPPPGHQPQKILVILLSEMGSLVLASPMFERLKRNHPGASLYALVFSQNQEVLSLLDAMPEARIFSIRNSSLAHLAADSLRALSAIRAEGIDTVIDCELFSRISSLCSFLSGATARVGFHRHTQEGLYRGDFINRPVLYNPYLHIAHQFINLAEALGAQGYPLVKRPVTEPLAPPRCAISRAEIEAISLRLAADFPHLGAKKLVLVYPGGGLLPIRAWPLTSFYELVDGFTCEGYAVGIIGMMRDKEIAQKILTRCGGANCLDLTGYTRTVRELVILLHLSCLLVTNDGGPCHFASMTPIPSITLFGPETPALYGPLGANAEVFFTGISCAPCVTAYNHRRSPCNGDNVCLKLVKPGAVLQKAKEILAKSDPPTRPSPPR